jgi:hypothetical protein
MEEKYLLYFDILGFSSLADQIAQEKGIDPQEVRDKFLDTIEGRISFLKNENKISGSWESNTDSWLLVMETFDQVLENISIILDHNTRYHNYSQIPVEFAIGIGTYDKWGKLEGQSLIIEPSTIAFLKTEIIPRYHKWFHTNFPDEKIIPPYVLMTQLAYDQLEPVDQRIWKRIIDPFQSQHSFFATDCSIIKEKSQILNFLSIVGYSGTKRYRRLDETFVEPVEYRDMIEALKEKRILFIVGTQEFGKTFTAVKLLWEFFKEGYLPKWIKGEEPKDRIVARIRLQNIKNELKPRHVFYFEDPFGMIKYESREGLEREIGTIIDTINQVPDTFVIITSREEVFKKFEKENISADRVKEFERKLNIKRNSYPYEKRKQILLNWALVENCEWLHDQNLKEVILEYIKNFEYLPTPLSLKSFATSTRKIVDEESLTNKVREKSEETAKSFAKEIKFFSSDKKLFLSFPFIGTFDYEFVKRNYNELKNEMKITEGLEIERVIAWFKDDKIDTDFGISFSHPSYEEGLKFLLIENNIPTRFNTEIFSKVLEKIAHSEEKANGIDNCLSTYFHQLPFPIVCDALLSLSDDPSSASGIARILTNKYSILPKENQESLFKIARYDDIECSEAVASGIIENYSKLPREVQEIIFTLSKNEENLPAICYSIVENYESLPNELTILLNEKVRLSNEASAKVLYSLLKNIDDRPKELKELYQDILGNEEAIQEFASFFYFGGMKQISIDRFYEILNKISQSDLSLRFLSFIIESNFGKINEDIRNEMLIKLSKNKESAGQAAYTIISHYHSLPREISQLLYEIVEIPDSLFYIERALNSYFETLPKKCREFLIRKLSQDRDSIFTTSHLICKYYHELSEDIQYLLIGYSENDDFASQIIFPIICNFDSLPPEITILLENLSKNKKTAGRVGAAIVCHYNDLPKTLQRRLLEIMNEEETLIEILPEIIRCYEELPDEIRLYWRFLENNNDLLNETFDAFVNNYEHITEEIRTIFFNYSQEDDSAQFLIPILIENYVTLHRDLKKLLKKYVEDEKTSVLVGLSICDDGFLDPELRRVFKKILENPKSLEEITNILKNDPDAMRNMDKEIKKLLAKKYNLVKLF